ncbi:hypothetical protein ACGFS9_29420 [Streptomyces sp. NPDC048566]|uniref:hypothetical protein n=1 Tax=Streptomyces sp. NPDC048566 TaxID=3365569 RepID=UPI00371CB3F9
MNDDCAETDRPARHNHGPGHLRGAAQAVAPPLQLAGADDDAATARDTHIIRGID